MKVLIAASLFLLTGLTPVAANVLKVYELATDSEVNKITLSGDHVIVKTRNSKHQILRSREGAFTLEPPGKALPAAPDLPEGSLPDGEIATGSGNIRKVWLSAPTTRYGHAVLGDAIEAGAVTAELSDGSIVTYTLPETSVFEDRFPRLVDIDGDGETEILLVKAWLDQGAALIVIALNNGKLEVRAEAEAIGQSNRWLNPVGVGDFDNDGRNEIAAVITPHIGGTLQLYEMQGNHLVKDHSAYGFSNHAMGSRNLGLSVMADLNAPSKFLRMLLSSQTTPPKSSALKCLSIS